MNWKIAVSRRCFNLFTFDITDMYNINALFNADIIQTKLANFI